MEWVCRVHTRLRCAQRFIRMRNKQLGSEPLLARSDSNPYALCRAFPWPDPDLDSVGCSSCQNDCVHHPLIPVTFHTI